MNIDRRTFLARSALSALSAQTAIAPAVAVGKTSQPNIVFIMADDLGYADLSCYGRDDYSTLHIDRLAREGMRFTSAYANSAVCSATRTALITGRYQYRLPIGLEEPLTYRKLGLPADQVTLPSLMRSAGYTTALIGKWHLGELPNFGPLQSGYDHFWGFRGGGVDYFTHRSATAPDLWDGDVPIRQTGYLTDLLGERAVTTLQEFAKNQRPFLMSLHFNAPHWPWEEPASATEAIRLASATSTDAQMHWDGGNQAIYAEMVKRLDYQVGQVLAELKKLRLDRNTIVIFTSDNGGERFSKNWPFSGRKTELLEGGLRVPAIIRWPGHIPAGATSEAPMMSMDWMPTLMNAAGVVSPPGFYPDGIDIGPAFIGATLPTRDLFWRYKYQDQQAMRRGAMKYLRIAGNSFLFDVVRDPMERANLKDINHAEFVTMKAVYDQWNGTMLPLDPQSFTHGFTGDKLADHFQVSDH
jgi:arylsulfatase A-like enzyme